MINIDHFKKKLEEEKALVLKELGELGWKNPATGGWEATAGDIDSSATEGDELADRMEEQEEHGEEIAVLEGRLTDIASALEKIETGTYGKCEISGEEIEPERLEANPAARTCMKHM
jgi:RNA polymerase-binding transcription factor DksA